MSHPVTGRSLGLLVCLACQATVRATPAAHLRCPRCRARLHERKPHSLALTAALVMAAAVLYVPGLPIWLGLAVAFAARNSAVFFTKWYSGHRRSQSALPPNALPKAH